MRKEPQSLLRAAVRLEETAGEPSAARHLGLLLEQWMMETARVVLSTDPIALYKIIRRSGISYLFVLGCAQFAGHTGLTSADIGRVLKKQPRTVRRHLRDSELSLFIGESPDRTDRRRKLYFICEPLRGNVVPVEFGASVARTTVLLREIGAWDSVVVRARVAAELRGRISRSYLDRFLMAAQVAVVDVVSWGQRLRELLEVEYGDSQASRKIFSMIAVFNDLIPLLQDATWRSHLVEQLFATVSSSLGMIESAVDAQVSDEGLLQLFLASLIYAIANGEPHGQHTTPTHGSDW